MARKLHYFDTNGIAESVRYMLHYAKQKFEDVRYDYQSWPVEQVKKSLPFGQLPLYEEGSKSLYQSVAIARYIGAVHNLIPADIWEQAQLDAIVLSVYDFWSKVIAYVTEQDIVKKQELKKEIFGELIDFYFSRFENQLKNNKGFFGGKLSWADFVFVGIIEAVNLRLGEQIESKYPHVAALVEKIRNLPGVKEYIVSKKPYVL
ncbi:glutathione S-transferase-like [Danaus plexippus]|uniref:glutathione transferase n=1 Tax=Danaus plexippus plexippus TaxID=278856 RepID=A0A212FN54_DANPL|nr:glutathione S-transferase-like [Danaus plexippus plexippus]XP_032515879.1 glutathione S-transferase-like [Danaus plexippus]OWR51757.1 glutathione S-transferase [Danaus plexippus plexippus]OWR55186.1 glutathione S-transferase [Danaus plexippus plexippus]